MKTCVVIGAIALFCFHFTVHSDVIAQWNFNGSEAASDGQGTAHLIGSATAAFAGGCTNDPASSGNQGWNLAHFPAQGGSNKLAGAQFDVSTLGFSQIQIRWDQRVSSTASKYCRLQYSTDGFNYYEAPNPVTAYEVSGTSSYFEPEVFSLEFVYGVEDNPNFSFRIVSEFESSALGYGLDEYVTTYSTNSYRTTGTIRLDMLTVSGTRIPGANTPPHITAVPDQIVRVLQSTVPVAVTVSDAEDTAESLVVVGTSSSQAVVPDSNIQVTESGAQRTISVTATAQPGTATVTLTVTDTGGRSNATDFVVTVLPANTVPVISAIAPTNSLPGIVAGPIPFTIGDLESAPDSLVLSATSANPGLLPSDMAHISFSGTGSNRTVTLTPLPGQSGIAPVIIQVGDGLLSATSPFALMVTPSPSLLLCDSFNYPDGSVVTNSGFLWDNRSGTVGQCQVANGALQINSTQTEDVLARLAGAPYTRSNGTILYASFKMKFLGVPKSTPDYFAHFVGGTALRARIFAQVADAFPGSYHLLIANGSTTNTLFAAALSTNTTYTVVTRYDIDNAVSTLWVNPSSENIPGAIATDPQTAVTITSYGFRQDSGMGATVLIDDVKVGLSFASVMEQTSPSPIPLALEHNGNRVILRWTDPAFALQASASLQGTFTNIPNATSPYTNTINGSSKYFRLQLTP